MVNVEGYVVTKKPWVNDLEDAEWYIDDRSGQCDSCGVEYKPESRADHCVEEGMCWDCCAAPDTHLEEQEEEDAALSATP